QRPRRRSEERLPREPCYARRFACVCASTKAPIIRDPPARGQRRRPLVPTTVSRNRRRITQRRGGGNGRRKGLKIPRASGLCGFDSHPRHQGFQQLTEIGSIAPRTRVRLPPPPPLNLLKSK